MPPAETEPDTKTKNGSDYETYGKPEDADSLRVSGEEQTPNITVI
jgi:hypothetical protein